MARPLISLAALNIGCPNEPRAGVEPATFIHGQKSYYPASLPQVVRYTCMADPDLRVSSMDHTPTQASVQVSNFCMSRQTTYQYCFGMDETCAKHFAAMVKWQIPLSWLSFCPKQVSTGIDCHVSRTGLLTSFNWRMLNYTNPDWT